MKLARTAVLLIGLPCMILAATAGVVLCSCQATWSLLLKTWSNP